ncbi:MAG: hypothetical protein ACNI27_13370 [Desulfovibrio sp.]
MRKLLYGIAVLMIFAGMAVAVESNPCLFVGIPAAKQKAVEKAIEVHGTEMGEVRGRFYKAQEDMALAMENKDNARIEADQAKLMKIRGEIMTLWSDLEKEIEKITGVKKPFQECPGLLGRSGCRSGRDGGCPFALE